MTNKEYRKKMENQIHEILDDSVPSVYASIALALFKKHDWDYDQINELFMESEEIWSSMDNKNMIQVCEEQTGILLKGENTLKNN